MSDSLCAATLQLFIALVRTKDPAIIDCLLPPSTATPDTAAAATAGSSPFTPTLDAFGALFDGLTDPRSHSDFADTLLDVQRRTHAHSTLDTALPIPLPLPLPPATAAATVAAAAAAEQATAQLRPSVVLSVSSLPSADRAMFGVVALNKLDGWLDSSQQATNVLLSALLAALACDRRPHVQLLMMGRQQTAASRAASATAGDGADRSVLSSVQGLWRAGRRREHRIPSLPHRLAGCRAAMTAQQRGGAAALSDELSATVASRPAAADDVNVQRFLRAWLLLEAFVVELAAIQYSQLTQHSTHQTAQPTQPSATPVG